MGSMIGSRSVVLHDLRIFIPVTEVYEKNVVSVTLVHVYTCIIMNLLAGCRSHLLADLWLPDSAYRPANHYITVKTKSLL